MGFSLTTFLFEIVNFLVLVWILGKLIYRPLQRSLVERRAALAGREQAAADQLKAAETLALEAKSQTEQIEELRQRTMREATEQAAEERARLLAEAREDAAAERTRAERMVDAERATAHAWVREVAVRHAADVAGRMLVQLAPQAVEGALLDMLVDEIGRRGDALREAAGEVTDVSVTGARMPNTDAVERLRQALAGALGRAPRLTLHEDGALGGGLVVRVAGTVLDASIAGELDAFRERVLALLEPQTDAPRPQGGALG